LVNQVVAYALAVGQKKYGVLVHMFCVMSNHWHLLLTDLYGNLPHFLRDVHVFGAKQNGPMAANQKETTSSSQEFV
jgi:hypothetical protein